MAKAKAAFATPAHRLPSFFLCPLLLTLFFCCWTAYHHGSLPLSISLLHDPLHEYRDPACDSASTSCADRAGNHVGTRHLFSVSFGRSSSQPLPPLHLQESPKVVTPRVSVSRERADSARPNAGLPRATQALPAEDTNTTAVKEVERIMRKLRGAASDSRRPSVDQTDSTDFSSTDDTRCKGKWIFMYDLPTKFNVDLLHRCRELIPWQNMCDFLGNSGMGRALASYPSKAGIQELVPSDLWYETHQYSLEVLFHERLKNYRCLTSSPDMANLFYIPYYGGLDVLRWHFVQNTSAEQIDKDGLELIRWLDRQPSWRRNEGFDHVLVLGKITWDFRRAAPSGKLWGSTFLLQEQTQNITKLLIERQPWHEHEVGVPHPTFFHPRRAEDIRAWQEHISKVERRYLVSFAGQPRPNQPESIRSHLIRQCRSNASSSSSSTEESCNFLNCAGGKCFHPTATMELFMHSEFCMQPPGDSPTRRSVFDSLVAGCIPVIFDPYTAYYQYPWHLPADEESYSVYIAADEVRAGKVNVLEELGKIPQSVREEMRHRIIYEIMPGLVYASPDAKLEGVEDAFLVSLRSLFAWTSARHTELVKTAS